MRDIESNQKTMVRERIWEGGVAKKLGTGCVVLLGHRLRIWRLGKDLNSEIKITCTLKQMLWLQQK